MNNTKKKENLKPDLVLVVDIETSGPNVVKNDIISIGYVIGTVDGNVIEKNKINVKWSESRMDKNCYETFWKNKKDLLVKLSIDQKSQQQAIKLFIDTVDAYEGSCNDFYIVSDNPTFDIGFINYYLALYLGRHPLNYKADGKTYRHIHDTESYTRGFLGMEFKDKWVDNGDVIDDYNFKMQSKSNTHMPDEDACYIYEFYGKVIAQAVSKQ
jgi:hypothetical protein